MTEVRELFNTIVIAHNRLRELGVMRSQRFLSDFGEWLAEMIFAGERATNPVQNGWDIKAGNKKIQVKTHAKASSNSYSRTPINCHDDADFDDFVLIILSQEFYIKAVYRISKEELAPLIDRNGKVPWKSLEGFRVSNELLAHNNMIRPFLLNQSQ